MAAAGLRCVRLKYQVEMQGKRLSTFTTQQTLPLTLNEKFWSEIFKVHFSDNFPLVLSNFSANVPVNLCACKLWAGSNFDGPLANPTPCQTLFKPEDNNLLKKKTEILKT